METTLIVNPGSTSKKYALYQDGRTVMILAYEQAADEHALCMKKATGQQNCQAIDQQTYLDSFRDAIERAVAEEIITDKTDIKGVGVRVVAPGTFFQNHRQVDEDYLNMLHNHIQVAPLHVPPILNEIELIQDELPKAMLVGVSDSAFHSTMPEMTRRYTVDREDADALDLYRFGYHGLSVSSVVHRAHAIFGVDPERLLVVHIGGGVSVTALRNGKTFDTSMGYAPGSGLVMSTRAGDLDSGALLELMRGKHMRQHDVHTYLQTKGGLWGIAGERDLRVVMQRWAQGDEEAATALSMFLYHIKMRIGAYMAGMGGLDAIVLTATAAERNFELRSKLLSGLSPLGIDLDEDKNDRIAGSEGLISTPESPVKVAVMLTNEMSEIYHVVTKFMDDEARL